MELGGQVGAVGAQEGAEVGDVHGVDVGGGSGRGEGGGESGGFAHRQARGHDADAALDDLLGGDAAAGHEDVAQAFGREAAIGDAVGFSGAVVEGVFLLGFDALLVVFGGLFLGLVDVDKIAVAADLVVEGLAGHVVVEREHVVAGHTAGFAHAHHGTGESEEGVAEGGGSEFGESVAEGLGEFAAGGESAGNTPRIGVVEVEHVSGVETDGAGADQIGAEVGVGDK